MRLGDSRPHGGGQVRPAQHRGLLSASAHARCTLAESGKDEVIVDSVRIHAESRSMGNRLCDPLRKVHGVQPFRVSYALHAVVVRVPFVFTAGAARC